MIKSIITIIFGFLLSVLFIFSDITPAQAATQTIIFDDKSGQDVNLTGQYPTGVINWGSTHWYLSGPWGLFTTKSVSFRKQSQTSGVFTFINSRRVVSFQAYNGGTVASTVTIACSGNTTKSQSVPVGQLVTITTGWLNLCTTVTMTSSNGWNTNFDNIVIDNTPGDTTPPTVSITAPTEGATVTGSTVVSANASDAVGIAGVQFKLDGNNLGSEDTTSPYSVSWDTVSTTNGNHILIALARDTANNQTTSTAVNVTVNNPPVITIIQPVEGASITGTTVNVVYTVSGDLTSADHAHLYLDNWERQKDVDFDGAYTFENVPVGTHTLRMKIAAADHTELSQEDVVTFATTAPDTEPPVVSISSPVNEATVSGTITITAGVTDNTAVAGVQFKVDGLNQGAEDTTAPYSVSWNTTSVANGNHIITAVARDTSSNSSTSTPVNVTVNNIDARATVGEWSPVMNWPHVAIHTTLMQNGKVLMWDGWGGFDGQSYLWDPATNTFTNAILEQNLYFCAGHTQLADGRVLAMGGHNNGSLGNNRSTVFSLVTNSWFNLPNIAYSRWYPSSTRLSDGRVLVIGGLAGSNWAQYPEIFNPENNTWSTLTTTGNYSSENDDEYPLSFRLPDGRIYSMAATPGRSYMLDVTGAAVTPSAVLPRKLGSAAQYRPGKVLYTGGGVTKASGATSLTGASVIDFNSPTPAWSNVPSMQNPRYEHNLTTAADGKVYAVGGASVVSQETNNGTLSLEMFDPDSETWSTMASMTDKRMYHSTSLLMPDGRILSAGGGRLGVGPNVLSAQLYSPGYLFKGSRPVISNAPSNTEYGQTITVDSSQAQSIQKISFIPLGSNTHTLDMNQTFIELNFNKAGNTLEVQMPTNKNIAVIGDYMLFIIDGNGVPSVAKIISLKNVVDITAPVVSLTEPAAEATVSGTIPVSATATDNIEVSSVQFKVDGNNIGNPDTSAPYSINWDTTSISNGPHTLNAQASDSSTNTSTSSPVNITVDNPVDSTPPVISAVTSTNISTTGATIIWSTDENGDSQVEYGTDTNYGSSTTLVSTLVTSHSQALSGLSVNTLYHYRVKSKDASGNLATSNDFTFTTAAFNPQTIDFNNATGQDVVFEGQYPSGVIDWGTNIWFLSSPWGQFTTKSISFNGSGETSGAFTLMVPKTPVSVQAYNGGTVASTVTLACTGNTTKSQSVSVNSLVTITTDWTNPCSTVTVTSSNGWNTNFDNLIIQ